MPNVPFLRQQFFPFFLTKQRVLQFERVTTLPYLTLPYPKIHKPKSFQASFIARSLIITKTRGSTCALKIYMRNWNLGIRRTTGPHPVGYKKGVSLPYPPFTLLFEATHQRSQWKRNKTHSTRNKIEMIVVSLLK